ncbi:MAG: nicotinate (nicotinamide) nucleotide adenylyltransferase [Fimbriimonadaceae bacterium]
MKSGSQQYAIFGGSFDPPHLGHLAVAEACFEHLEVNEVIWVPNHRNPLRHKAFATAVQRLQMCQLATEGHDGMAVSDIEVSRGAKSYTIDTVEELLMVRPGKIWVIMGSDSLDGLMGWKEPEKLLRQCRLAVVVRPGADMNKALSQLTEDMRDSIDLVPITPHKASSTQVRYDILREGTPELMLDPKVWDYIKEHGLYHD